MIINALMFIFFVPLFLGTILMLIWIFDPQKLKTPPERPYGGRRGTTVGLKKPIPRRGKRWKPPYSY